MRQEADAHRTVVAPQGGRRLLRIVVRTLFITSSLVVATPAAAIAQQPASTSSTPIDNPLGIPDLRNIAPPATDVEGVSASLAILVLMTVLSLAPAILVMTTSFTRIVIVLALLRQALGTQQLPPGQILIGLALVMSALIMAPTWQQIQSDALDPYMAGELSQREALKRAGAPLRDFMIRQVEAAENEEDVFLFVEYGRGAPWPADETLTWDNVRMWELVPAFVLSELKVAFIKGFQIYLPFLVIDMVIAAILISMGMMMLPPVLISLPIKLMLFVVADGWQLVAGSLLSSFA
ncbi:MAG: flagellar type III secretion system pore protein FliP [Phycisphaerae bacterium]